MKVCLLVPFGIDSHTAWAKAYQHHSQLEVKVYAMSGSHWKWRMHGAAVSLAKKLNEANEIPDLVLCTDMMDLAVFKSLLSSRFREVPICLYFHENQLTYPWSASDPDKKNHRDRHYAWINFTSALVAERVFFNSAYHKKAFINALPDFLRAFPDHQEIAAVKTIAKKSEVLPLGTTLFPTNHREKPSPSPKHILWNHRWEYDKNPDSFFRLMFRLQEVGLDFRLHAVGRSFQRQPAIFKEAKERLAPHIDTWGFVESTASYRAILQQSDILPVTAIHDFFGLSVVEAIHAGVYPLLPDRLAYPEHISPTEFPNHYYQDEEELFIKLKEILRSPEILENFEPIGLVKYDWKRVAPMYDQVFQQLCNFRHTET
ncbi:MAG: DUF3524 domain-containing protein [Bacteroidota bacterium]